MKTRITLRTGDSQKDSMASTPYHNFVHFTPRSIFWILVLLVVLTAPIWWTSLRAGTAKAGTGGKKPDLSGEWIGTAHITSYANGYNPATPLDQQGSFSLNLQTYDGFLERYRGQGTFQIGEESSRNIKVTGLSLGEWSTTELTQKAGGALRLEANLSGDLEQKRPSDDATTIQGRASADRIQFSTVATVSGYVFQVDLHRKN